MLELVSNQINEILGMFNAYAKNNQIVAGFISVWALGVFSYLMRNVPLKIWQFIAKHSTTKMTLTSSHEAYHNFLKWLKINGYLTKARSFKISCGMWGYDSSTKSIGYGHHYFMYKFRPFKIDMVQKETHSNQERDEITITVLGRSHKFFNKIHEEIDKVDKSNDMLPIYKYSDCWNHIAGQRKRPLDKVFIEEDIQCALTGHIEAFNSNEDWYVRNGLSYQTGILLYGPPGTGKTSVVKALASHFDKPLYILSPSSLIHIEVAFSKLPEKSILLIEDIDTDAAVHSRGVPEGGPKTTESNQSSLSDLSDISFTNLSDVLNTIDGIVSSHGRILIATTNHFEKLDEALLRSGRFDLKVGLGHTSINTLKQFFDNYYPNFNIPQNFEIKSEVAPADVQNLILNSLDNPKKVLNKLRVGA